MIILFLSDYLNFYLYVKGYIELQFKREFLKSVCEKDVRIMILKNVKFYQFKN
jgi:hypothetical protein